ncbi:MAG: hypothetical protein R2715_21855 [Ilumatobacteraceae bacterium]
MTGADGRPHHLRQLMARCGVWDLTIPITPLWSCPGHTDRVWAVGVMTGADGRPRIISGRLGWHGGCGTRTIPITPLWSCPVTPARCWRWA